MRIVQFFTNKILIHILKAIHADKQQAPSLFRILNFFVTAVANKSSLTASSQDLRQLVDKETNQSKYRTNNQQDPLTFLEDLFTIIGTNLRKLFEFSRFDRKKISHPFFLSYENLFSDIKFCFKNNTCLLIFIDPKKNNDISLFLSSTIEIKKIKFKLKSIIQFIPAIQHYVCWRRNRNNSSWLRISDNTCIIHKELIKENLISSYLIFLEKKKFFDEKKSFK